ncbi:hypothetical protein HCN44_011199 [Aphidius gifuensis]|uniref:Calpain catalytic domain-containing protein n=1 Tax=Aphidius gifuensis TaxID=684658 RepID=A0A834XUZ1_APHGI|nr:hypothetical protein HCN44_011199 [Aphidius gifuensis]
MLKILLLTYCLYFFSKFGDCKPAELNKQCDNITGSYTIILPDVNGLRTCSLQIAKINSKDDFNEPEDILNFDSCSTGMLHLPNYRHDNYDSCTFRVFPSILNQLEITSHINYFGRYWLITVTDEIGAFVTYKFFMNTQLWWKANNSTSVNSKSYQNGETIEFLSQDFRKIRKNLLKNRQLFEDDEFSILPFSKNAEINFMRPKDIVKKPVLVSKKNKNFFIKQGLLEDCWFVVGMINLYQQKALFSFVVPDDQSFDDKNYAGIFHFRFWQSGKWIDVVVDDRLLIRDNYTMFSRSGDENEFWPSLMEKAYAKLISNSYRGLSLATLNQNPNQNYWGGITVSYPVNDKNIDSFQIISQAYRKNSMLSCSSNSDSSETIVDMKLQGLKPDHGYAITAVQMIRNLSLIRIKNPHGLKIKNIYIGDIKDKLSSRELLKLKINADGESWILFEDFIKYFSRVHICHLTPNNIVGDIFNDDGTKKLQLTTVEGRLMGPVDHINMSSHNSLLHNSPQYNFTLSSPNKNITKCKIIVSLSLKRGDDLNSTEKTKIGFYIIHLNSIKNAPKPLNSQCSQCVAQIKKSNKYFRRGQKNWEFSVLPGTYFIIPFIEDTIGKANYILQILSEEANILELYDKDVEISDNKTKFENVTEEIIISKNYSTLKPVLESLSIDKHSIDFKDLYRALMSPNALIDNLRKNPLELDKETSLKLQSLIESKEFKFGNQFNNENAAKIYSTSLELFEKNQVENNPGYIQSSFLKTALNSSGYDLADDLLGTIISKYKNQNNMIHLNDYIKTIIIINNKINTNRIQFTPKFCRDLITITPNHEPEKKALNKIRGIIYTRENAKIGWNEFLSIMEFISHLKIQ